MSADALLQAQPPTYSENICAFSRRCLLATDDDVVDWDEDELHGVANEAHDAETDGASSSDLLELLRIWLSAALDQTARVVGKLNSTLDAVANWVGLVGHERRQVLQRRGSSSRHDASDTTGGLEAAQVNLIQDCFSTKP